MRILLQAVVVARSFVLSARRRFDPSLAVFAKLACMVSKLVIMQPLIISFRNPCTLFSLRLLVTRDFLAPLLRLLVTAARCDFFELTELYCTSLLHWPASIISATILVNKLGRWRNIRD